MKPNEVPTSANGQARYPAGKGEIGVLATPAWQRGCPSCSIAMVTAVAQNGPAGNVPKLPLKDGASFGLVLWRGARLFDGNAILSWTAKNTAQTLTWKKGITKVDMTGVPPNYNVFWVEVPCVPSLSGDDRWLCGKGTIHK